MISRSPGTAVELIPKGCGASLICQSRLMPGTSFLNLWQIRAPWLRVPSVRESGQFIVVEYPGGSPMISKSLRKCSRCGLSSALKTCCDVGQIRQVASEMAGLGWVYLPKNSHRPAAGIHAGLLCPACAARVSSGPALVRNKQDRVERPTIRPRTTQQKQPRTRKFVSARMAAVFAKNALCFVLPSQAM